MRRRRSGTVEVAGRGDRGHFYFALTRGSPSLDTLPAIRYTGRCDHSSANSVRGESRVSLGSMLCDSLLIFGANPTFTGGARDIPAQMLSRAGRGVLVQPARAGPVVSPGVCRSARHAPCGAVPDAGRRWE